MTAPPPRLVPDRPSDDVAAAVAIMDLMPELQRLLELRQYSDTDGPMEVTVGTDLIDDVMYEIRDTIGRLRADNLPAIAAAQAAEAPAELGDWIGELIEAAKDARWRIANLVGPSGAQGLDRTALNRLDAALAAAPAGDHVLRFGPFTVSASDEGGSWSIVVSKGRKVCALVDDAAPAAPAEGVMGWATPDGRVCSARDKALALVQDASAYTIALAPRVTGGRAVGG